MKITMPRFNQAQVVVVGDIMLDRYWHGATHRISPEAPVPVVKVDDVDDRAGGAGNVALNIAALGAGVSLLGITGNDEAADSLESRLTAAQILCDFIRVDNQPTITKLRVISRHQQLLRMDFEEKFIGKEAEVKSKLDASLKQNTRKIGAVILSDYNKGTLSNPEPLIALAKAQGIPVLVDPKGTNFMPYKGATLLTPNYHEFIAVVGECASEEELIKKGLQLITTLDLEALLITRGENGMTLLRKGESELHLPAKAREVFDVTGAGDTVIATLAASLAAGESLPDAVALANIAAGVVVGKLGTALVSGPELRLEISKDQGSERGVVSLEQLKMALVDARVRGERIVFTNGCFDIIHAGHVGYLEEAAQLGDRLIVAINDDASVTRLKGSGRPINPVDRRMAVLAGLESVDWVLSYSADTPESLLKELQPEVLVKGGDYAKEHVVGWEIVEGYGGSVKVLNFFDDCSTTAIVEKVLKNQKPL